MLLAEEFATGQLQWHLAVARQDILTAGHPETRQDRELQPLLHYVREVIR